MTGEAEDREASRLALRSAFVSRYHALVGVLARRLGSADKASDALHDVWLRLDRGGQLGSVRDPFAYLVRSAINADHQRRKLETRRAQLLEEQGEIAPTFTDGEDEIERRSRRAAARRALGRLPERRQAIFLAVWAEERPVAEIAERFRVSVRTVQHELQRALEEIASELKEK